MKDKARTQRSGPWNRNAKDRSHDGGLVDRDIGIRKRPSAKHRHHHGDLREADPGKRTPESDRKTSHDLSATTTFTTKSAATTQTAALIQRIRGKRIKRAAAM